MKKVSLFFASLAMVAFVACNNAAEEAAVEETVTEEVAPAVEEVAPATEEVVDSTVEAATDAAAEEVAQ